MRWCGSWEANYRFSEVWADHKQQTLEMLVPSDLIGGRLGMLLVTENKGHETI
jgi:hypothetical protein